MQSRRHSAIGPYLVLAASLGLVTSVAVRAQRGGGGGAAPKPFVPVAASSLISNPDPYLGQIVSVTGVAERSLTATAFTFDQGKMQRSPGDVLVIAPTLIGKLPLQAYITVIGDAVKFDPAEVAKKFRNYTLDLPADVIEKYRGKPAVLATSVIDPTMTDIAKPVVPPPTPAEAAFDGVMKQVGPGFAAMQQAVNGSQADQVRQQAIALSKLFGDTQTFFTTRKTADAIQWATDAAKRVHDIDEAAAAGKWDDAKAAATGLNQLCGSCHAAHREREDDGTYRVKG